MNAPTAPDWQQWLNGGGLTPLSATPLNPPTVSSPGLFAYPGLQNQLMRNGMQPRPMQQPLVPNTGGGGGDGGGGDGLA